MTDPGGGRSGVGATRGHLVLFLHAHLPYIRHPEDGNLLEEDWLYEAITETYIPLLAIAERWASDRIGARLTLSLSPTLLEMLRDELLITRYAARLEMLISLSESELVRTSRDDRFRATAQMYHDRLTEAKYRLETIYAHDLVSAFKSLQERGVLEIVTTCASHTFLPSVDADYARAQIRLGVDTYRRCFDRLPAGMWLPECGYVPGLDRLLAEAGIDYFLVDSHGLELADPAPIYGTYAPIVSPAGVFAFARDASTSAQVWSAEVGYPGDGRYREFYRDIGHDSDAPEVVRLRLDDGAKRNVGLKYHRVTGRDVRGEDKKPYDRASALQAVAEHAEHFVSSRTAQIENWCTIAGRPAVIAAPYDAELFGHWWFEGPEFLDLVVRKSCARGSYRLSSPRDVLDSGLDFQVAVPAQSSWGDVGYNTTWVNDRTMWIWPHVHHVIDELQQLADEMTSPAAIEVRALNQLAREVVLATASDWPFIITSGTVVSYAERRIRTHINRANRLIDQLRDGSIDAQWLTDLEAYDNVFADIDFRAFRRRSADLVVP